MLLLLTNLGLRERRLEGEEYISVVDELIYSVPYLRQKGSNLKIALCLYLLHTLFSIIYSQINFYITYFFSTSVTYLTILLKFMILFDHSYP